MTQTPYPTYANSLHHRSTQLCHYPKGHWITGLMSSHNFPPKTAHDQIRRPIKNHKSQDQDNRCHWLVTCRESVDKSSITSAVVAKPRKATDYVYKYSDILRGEAVKKKCNDIFRGECLPCGDWRGMYIYIARVSAALWVIFMWVIGEMQCRVSGDDRFIMGKQDMPARLPIR